MTDPIIHHGTSLCPGQVEGVALIINQFLSVVPANTIGVFATATADYTPEYHQCVGILFFQGSVTSHGAIIARESNIPTITDPGASIIKDGDHIVLDANQGVWFIKSD